jgi:hypothetical protein
MLFNTIAYSNGELKAPDVAPRFSRVTDVACDLVAAGLSLLCLAESKATKHY